MDETGKMSLRDYHALQLSLSGHSGHTDLFQELTHFDPVELFKQLEGLLPPPHCEEKIKEIMMMHEKKKAGKLFPSDRFSQLKRDLNVTVLSSGDGAPALTNRRLLTINRLRTMFPHFCNLEKLSTYGTVPTVERLHKIMQHPEFGGLIPSRKVLKDPIQDDVERLHLFCLCRAQPWLVAAQHFMLFKLRNEKSLLSDLQRVIILKNCGVLNGLDKLTPEMEEAVGQVKDWPTAGVFWPPAEFYKDQ